MTVSLINGIRSLPISWSLVLDGTWNQQAFVSCTCRLWSFILEGGVWHSPCLSVPPCCVFTFPDVFASKPAPCDPSSLDLSLSPTLTYLYLNPHDPTNEPAQVCTVEISKWHQQHRDLPALNCHLVNLKLAKDNVITQDDLCSQIHVLTCFTVIGHRITEYVRWKVFWFPILPTISHGQPYWWYCQRGKSIQPIWGHRIFPCVYFS